MNYNALFLFTIIFILGCVPQVNAPWEKGEIKILSLGDSNSKGVTIAPDGINFTIKNFGPFGVNILNASKSKNSAINSNSDLLAYLSSNSSTSLESFSFSSNNINYSFTDDRVNPDTIYSLTDDGVFVSTDRLNVPPFNQFLSTIVTISGDYSENNIFIGSNNGLYMATDTAGLSTVHSDVPTQIINHVLANSSTSPDHILLSTNDGLYISMDEGTNFTKHSDVATENISISISDWSTTYLSAGTSGAYLSIDTGNNFALIGTGTIVQSNTIQALEIGPNGEIYIGTNEGLAYSLDNGATFTELSSTSSNLIGNDILDLEVDHLGNLYVATDRGLSILRPGDSLFINETTEDGLSSNNLNSIDISYDSENNPEIFLGSSNGIIMIQNAMPHTPTSFSAVALNSSSADLTWVNGGGTTNGFKIAYKLGSITPTDCEDPTATIIDAGNTTSSIILGLTHLSLYTFKLCAYNELSVIDNNKSLDTFVNIPEDIAPLSNLSKTASSVSSIDIGWASNGGTTNGYRLSYLQSTLPPNDCSVGTDYTLGQTSLSLTGLNIYEAYSFRLCTINTTGFYNAGTILTTYTDQLSPPAPILNTITSITQNTLTVDYTENGGTTDHVKAIYLPTLTAPTNCLDGTSSSSSTTGTIAISGLTSNTDYTFVTCAYNITNNTSTVSNSITIKTGNFPPTDITLADYSILENLAIGTSVATMVESDIDPNETYLFSLIGGVGDGDNSDFTIVGDDLRSASIFDFESKTLYSIRLKVTDSNLNTFEEAINITILNDNDLPPQLVTPTSPIVVAEANSINTEDINDISGGDTDIEGDQITYSCFYDITPDLNVAHTLSCNSLGVDLINAADIDGIINWTPTVYQEGTYEFKIIGDDGVFNDSKYITLNVTHTNAPADSISLDSYNIFENQVISTAIGNLTATDIDGDAQTYSLVAGSGDTDNSDFNIIGSSLVSNASFDRETKNLYTLRIESNDGMGGIYSQSMTVSIDNLNDNTPTVTNFPISDPHIMNEGEFITFDINDASGGDTDLDGDIITYSCYYDVIQDVSVLEAANTCDLLSDSSNLLFNTMTGIFEWTPSYAQSANYEFIIVGNSLGGLRDDNIFKIDINNVNAPPVMVGNEVLQIVGKNSGVPNPLTTLNGSTDIDAQTPTYSLIVGPSKGTLTDCMGLNGSTGYDLDCNYEPNPGEEFLDSFTYQSSDGALTSGNSTIIVNILELIGDDTIGRNFHDGSYLNNCNQYFTSNAYIGATGTGWYWVDPQGGSPIKVYCDMINDGGGWTRISADIATSSKSFDGDGYTIRKNNLGHSCGNASPSLTITNVKIPFNYVKDEFTRSKVTQCMAFNYGSRIVGQYKSGASWVGSNYNPCTWSSPWAKSTSTDLSISGLPSTWKFIEYRAAGDRDNFRFRSTCSDPADNGLVVHRFWLK